MIEHVVAYSTENLKLFLSGESICSIAFFITLSICALDVIIGNSKQIQGKLAVQVLLQMQLVREQVQLGRQLLRMQVLPILQQVNTLLLF